MDKKIKVLIVDDSAVIRQLLSMLLSEDPEIEVVGTAGDPLIARDRIKALNPDVVTLDVEMPNMDGVTFLRKIMTLRPMPVVMVSTLTQAGAETTLEALEIGAVDFIAKPVHDAAQGLSEIAGELRSKVKQAARARVGRGAAAPRKTNRIYSAGKEKLVAIGASTGGVEALKTVLMDLPAECPPIVVTQHMPPRFTAAFAERLNRECPMKVSEAKHNDPIEPGHVYIAPGSHHLEVVRVSNQYRCTLSESAPVSGHRPSVDVLFRSVADTVGRGAVGAILTGMGKDGAEGLLAMRKAGAYTLGQDESSALIYGMPRVAFERGAVMKQVSLSHMADAIMEACESSARAAVRA
ncbi:protein-glutamate methylesterase/protein-glutamine glutaminase [Undibacter mobilis]|uniref:Protein-glutamate methylesterase/protein-glutamine glutaminase n=1 Tax=Undibacter mobilis TaxID=2292256 RepID=A0A371B7S6_9BRAD|nr:chemotaxis response regulator protein-glutamate methylesterase [Undibacter mobilis]RDV03503.1 chemotaxis response regulator protein-glutamate methylesterase [Undibacter mobilis]